MQTYRCPQCQSEIPIADVNVAADVALCRRCGTTTPFSLVSGVSELSFAQLEQPPKGVRVTQTMVGGTEIIYHRVAKIVFFLIPFVLLWGGLSVGGIYGKQIANGKFNLHDSLFGLPFLLGTVAITLAILFFLFGKWRVRLDRGQGEVFMGIGPAGWTRRFDYRRDSVISLAMASVRSNGVPQKAISVRTGAKEFKFGIIIDDEAKRYIAAAIAKECTAA